VTWRLAAPLLSLALAVAFPRPARAADGDAKPGSQKNIDHAKEEVTKADHRINESGCTASKAECARRKANDHLEEAKETAGDQINEVDHAPPAKAK
jgi:hypothetical protein